MVHITRVAHMPEGPASIQVLDVEIWARPVGPSRNTFTYLRLIRPITTLLSNQL